ncbi:hypothetical protein BC826DRAFT_1025122, partial [Russula brevipes]
MTHWLVPTAFVPSALSVTFTEGCCPHGYQINHALMSVLRIFSSPTKPPFFSGSAPRSLSQDRVKHLILHSRLRDTGHAS